jgi:AcrR family transcriptional regulator
MSPPEKRTRKTREEKRAEVRSDLIDAAAELFAERGYWGVSLDEIAERAGLTKGAVYSNFESKDDLLLAVAASQSINLDPAILMDESLTLTELARAAGMEVGRIATSSEQRRLAPRELELSTLALTNDKIRNVLTAFGRLQRETLARILESRAEAEHMELPLPPLELATIVWALGQGLTRHRFIDPEAVPAEYFADAFELLLSGAKMKASKRSPSKGSSRRRSRR